jgi:hypothetical protein
LQRRAEAARHQQPRPTSASRPLSTDDLLKIQESSFSHIEDWESLQTLLPDGVKRLITKRKSSLGTPVTTAAIELGTAADDRRAAPSFEPEIRFRRKPRPRSCDTALFLKKSFILEEAELEGGEVHEHRHSVAEDG